MYVLVSKNNCETNPCERSSADIGSGIGVISTREFWTRDVFALADMERSIMLDARETHANCK